MSSRIRQLRQERAKRAPRAFTAAALAGRLGVTESALLRWERGQALPRQRHQRALARELGVAVQELGLDGERCAHAPRAPQDGPAADGRLVARFVAQDVGPVSGNSRLRAARLSRGWTAEDVVCELQLLADRLEDPRPLADRVQVSKWETGARNAGPWYQARPLRRVRGHA